jgi:hypothetical protein
MKHSIAHKVVLSYLENGKIANTNYLLENRYTASPALLKHIEDNIPLCECLYRMGSDEYCRLMEEARDLCAKGLLKLSNEDDDFIVNKTASGKRGVYQGESVVLDSPKRNPGGSKKKFYVYVDSGNRDKDGKVVAKKIQWGDPNLTIKNNDPEAAKSFRARHKCDTKTDKKTPGYWACNVHRYHKQLGLSSNRPW